MPQYMTSDGMIHYPQLIDQAMRDMVRDVLRRCSASGLPGDHHFYVSLSTTHPGVRMSEQLRARYPKEITIVLQHQFWDFQVEDQRFQVTLSFGGVPEKIVVPFAAMTAFADPSVKFGLQFQAPATMSDALIAESFAAAEPSFDALPEEALDEGEKVVSLEAFRKK